MKHYVTALFALCCLSLLGQGTSKIDISLPEVIRIAQGDAPVAQIAETRLTNNYWQYQQVLGSFKPQLSLVSTLPNLNRSIDVITLPNGTDAFIDRSQMSTSLGVRLGQSVPSTGGFIFAQSRLQRIDLFANENRGASKSYLSAPLFIGFDQPIFQFNRFKWDKKLGEIEYEESKQVFAEEMEQIAYDAVELFFILYVAQLNLEEARRQKLYADSLYQISIGRLDVGRIAETELLQIELRSRNAEATQAQELLNYQSANEELRNFLGIQQDVQFNLLPPEALEDYDIDVDRALDNARKYRSETIAFRRRIMEAEMDLERANKSAGLSVSLQGSFALSQTAPELSDAYRNPIDQERLTLSLQVPIADWGLSRARREIARSNMDLTQRTVEQDNIRFERQVILKVQQIDLKRQQLALAQRALEVAEERLKIAKSRYQIGKIGVTDLNIALNENDTARRVYYQSMWSLWTAHYEIRNLTLYDFIEDRPLKTDHPSDDAR